MHCAIFGGSFWHFWPGTRPLMQTPKTNDYCDSNGVMFTPRLYTLPLAQLRLWDELSVTPEIFTLYGGTAIALRLGHRVSIDFDFFSPISFTPREMRRQIPYLAGGQVLQEAPNTLTISVEREGPVQLSFFGGLNLGQVEPHDLASGPEIKVASLVDMGGMKVAVVTQRAELKDYLDIHALLTEAHISLPLMLSAASVIYGEEFNPLVSLKAISYHDDDALTGLSAGIKNDLIAAVRSVDLEKLPLLSPVRMRTPHA